MKNIYTGNPDELDAALAQPNVIGTKATPAGTFVTFRVHGYEGTRTYFYPNADATALEVAGAVAELL